MLPEPLKAGVKLRGAEKVARIPVKILPTEDVPRKPDWIRVPISTSPEVGRIKALLRKHKLHSVCEEASCPNLGECFSGGTATFMITGDVCTRRCPFCDLGHWGPKPLDADEPRNHAIAIADLRLKYVVIISVDSDDLRDGMLHGALPRHPHLGILSDRFWPLAALLGKQQWVDSCRSRRTRALVTFDANGWSSRMQTGGQISAINHS